MTMPLHHNESLIYVVDDDDGVRDSLAVLIESGGFPVRSFESADAALAHVREDRPACILTDVRMPGTDGLAFQEKLAGFCSGVPVIIMTGHGDVPLAVRAMKGGAVDFIEKPLVGDVVLTSIAAAVGKSRADQPQESTATAALLPRLASLTPRERDVLDLLVEGHQNKVVAHRLAISPRTVEIHRARVMEKMQARSLPELVRMAMALGVAGPL
jgi:two-component system response regulator FixJ